MDVEFCLSKADCGAAERGERRKVGRYWRNLAHNEIAARYNDKTRFGLRLKCNKWRTDDDGLSVNCSSCTCAACSIIISEDPPRYLHVVGIDLQALRDAIGFDVVAIYDPLRKESGDKVDNPCHFLILPTEKSPEDLKQALIRLADWLFPKDRPESEEGLVAFQEARTRHAAIFDLLLEVDTATHALPAGSP